MFLLFVSILASVCVFVPFRHFLFEINTAFAEYYLTAHLISLPLVCVFRRRFTRFGMSVVVVTLLCLITLYSKTIIPFHISPEKGELSRENSRPLSVFLANVNVHNVSNASRVRDLIQKHSPDLVALLEVNEKWLDSLALKDLYSYEIIQPRKDNFGIALYSRYPHSHTRIFAGWPLPPVILTELQLEQRQKLAFGLVHALPPIDPDSYQHDYLLSRRVASHFRHMPGEVIVAGDFNATPFGRFYKVLVKGAELHNAAEGYGLPRTWNARVPIFRFSIDHIAFKGALRVTDYQILGDIGSDHYPLLVNFERKSSSTIKNSP